MSNGIPTREDFEKMTTAERAALVDGIARWRARFEQEVEAAISRVMNEIGVSPLSGEDLKEEASIFFFGAAVATATRTGKTVDELCNAVRAMHEALARADTDRAPENGG